MASICLALPFPTGFGAVANFDRLGLDRLFVVTRFLGVETEGAGESEGMKECVVREDSDGAPIWNLPTWDMISK